mgnify:CR=1 FL=1
MDGLATHVARRARSTALADTEIHDHVGAHDARREDTEHVAKGTGPPKKDGPFDAIASGVRGPP